jgi:hypothetical protein
MAENTKQVAIKPQQGVMSVESFISQAIASNVPIESLERLLAMRTQVKAEQAKEAFDEAMASAQGEFPVIEKKKEGNRTNSGVVAFMYAPIEYIEKMVRPTLTKYNLSSSFKTIITKDSVTVVCIAKHKLGHSDSSEIVLPIATKTNVMSDAQAVVSTVSFAKRYAFCNVFGITVGGEDNEKDLGKGKITEAIVEEVRSAKNEAQLKAVWEKHKGLGKEFSKIVTEHKKFLLEVTKGENGTA